MAFRMPTVRSRSAQDRKTAASLAVVSLLLAAVAISIYLPTFRYGFLHFDDDQYVSENARVQAGMTWEGVKWAFRTTHAANWHPLTWLSHMSDVDCFGMVPGRFHMMNVIMHSLNGVLLFLALFRLSSSVWRSAFVAAMFVVHPLHVESVAWISERKDVLSCFFWMLTMLAYAAYAARPGIARYVAVVVPFVLGLLSKPMLVTLPFVLLLLDYWPLGRLAGKARPATDGTIGGTVPLFRLVAEKLPLLLISAASCVITIVAQKEGGAIATLENMPFAARASNALVAYVEYLHKTVWPVSLSIAYPHLRTVHPLWILGGAAILLAAACGFSILQIRRRPWLATGWFWYLGTLVPVIGIMQVGAQAMADRYTYIPLIGIFILLVWSAADLAGKVRYGKAVLAGTGILLLIALSAAARNQVRYWENGVTLFRHAVETAGGDGKTYTQLGAELYEEGRVAEAEDVLRSVLVASPGFAPALRNLGMALDHQGRTEEAIRCYGEAVRKDPQNLDTRLRLGAALLKSGEYERSVEHLRFVTSRAPDFYQAFNNLGIALWETGHPEEAISNYRAALRVNPGYARARYNLGSALLSRGLIEEAISHLVEALRLQPDHELARKSLEIARNRRNR